MIHTILFASITCAQAQSLINQVYNTSTLTSAQAEAVIYELRKAAPENCPPKWDSQKTGTVAYQGSHR